jgi:hypothetical protein
MNNENIHSNHRGSSPPFQESEQDFYKWLKGLKSQDQRDETPSVMKMIRQPGKAKGTPTDLMDDSRWRDNGGEGG